MKKMTIIYNIPLNISEIYAMKPQIIKKKHILIITIISNLSLLLKKSKTRLLKCYFIKYD